ncbi:MAG: hypothetical protein ACRDVE_15295 [Actinocrinis sp.]
MGRPLQREHGSDRGYHQHVREKSLPCRPCLAAHAARAQSKRKGTRCAPGLGWPLEVPRG